MKVRARRQLVACTALTAAIKTIEQRLGAQGRVLVRFSGTESKLRMLVEGPTRLIVDEAIDMIETSARADLEVI